MRRNWFSYLLEATVALVLAFLVVQISTSISERRRQLLPPSSWFVVHEVLVPDHTQGKNPDVIYDRLIREDFVAFWIVEVQQVSSDGLFQTECSGFGTSEYNRDEVLENNLVSWAKLIGRECVVPPGSYRLRISYTMKRQGWPEKELLVLSNLFNVE